MPDFKSRLKELRKEKGLSQQELADLLGSTSVSVMRYEKGQRQPKLTTISSWERGSNGTTNSSLVNIAKLFDVSTDYLLGLSNVRNHKNTFDLSNVSTVDLLKEIERRCKC